MEYAVIAELLRRGFDVYMTLVDDQQIDCILRFGNNPPVYTDVQIKARSLQAKNTGMFASMKVLKPRENFIFIFYDEEIDTHWVMSSLDLMQEGNTIKSGPNIGKVKISFANKRVDGIWRTRPKFFEYENDFSRLIPNGCGWQQRNNGGGRYQRPTSATL